MWSQAANQKYESLKTDVETELLSILNQKDWPDSLRKSVEYSLMAGGKRLRPMLVLLAAECTSQGDPSNSPSCNQPTTIQAALPAACAVEMIHTYSLIHDDLPCMDDDDLRRGRPTNHVVFGEALATLAGDALLTLAFETLACAPTSTQVTSRCLKILATASGGAGMVGGQILDLEAERGVLAAGSPKQANNRHQGDLNLGEDRTESNGPHEIPREKSNSSSVSPTLSVDHLVSIHRMKTGALIRASLQLGAAVSEAEDAQFDCLSKYGDAIGLAFQIADDVLDVTGTNERLGKETGRDHQLGKLTYPALIGLDDSKQKARELVRQAVDALDIFDDRADLLRNLAEFIVERDH